MGSRAAGVGGCASGFELGSSIAFLCCLPDALGSCLTDWWLVGKIN